MLDGYISEKEQLDSIRKWWNENGKALGIAIVIGLAIGFGWKFWHKLAIQRAENASVLYQQVLDADAKNDIKTAQGGAVLLMQHFSNTSYASLGALLYAKEAVVQNQLPAALEKLQWVVKHGSVDRLKSVARINAARILLSLNRADEASGELKAIHDKAFLPLVDWVNGDIATKLGDTHTARKDYQKTLQGLSDFQPAQTYLNQLSAN